MTQNVLIHGRILSRAGTPVFFCNSDKRPTTPHGFHDAVNNPLSAERLYNLHPGPLLAVPTGAASGLDVLDLDLQHQPADEWWLANKDRIPLTRTHRTRSGGLHIFFQHHAGLRNTASKIAKGVDTRCDGGYVIWWPASDFEVLSTAPIAAWPAWLLAELRPKKAEAPQKSREAQDTLNDRKLRALVRFVAGAPDGQRNRMLYWAACRLAESRAAANITEDFAIAVLAAAAQRCGGNPPISDLEARRTIQSAMRRVS
ncbi:MAG TPA: bifunctional DNA primase/polymerase [Candidatus Angelobacter sp.]|jgi:hypothetical protein|nr:bifunctional DNA primase/polymerase [Candidatus Angelobacter sp.]